MAEVPRAPPHAPLLRSISHTVSQSPLTTALSENEQAVQSVLKEHAIAVAALSSHESAARELPSCELHGCVFVGHTATDMDSIGSAIGAAEIFEGVAARASDINTETAYALERFGVAVPPPFLEVPAGRAVCLVDHNQVSQMTAGVDHNLVRGIIDHHAMQKGTLVTDSPIYVDIRPWGSACTIVAHLAVARHAPIRPSTAGLLLCGILSDTLNLRSPTTTRFDRVLAGFLTRLAGVTDPDALAQCLFKAKSRMLDTLTPHGLVSGDNKRFDCCNPPGSPTPVTKVAFGVVETTDPAGVLALRDELLVELRAYKAEQGVDLSFLAVVDVVRLESTLLLCSADERLLAEAALGQQQEDGQEGGGGTGFKYTDASRTSLDLGSRVSRKKDFIPPISAAILRGAWLRPAERAAHSGETFGAVVHECGPKGCILRRMPSTSAVSANAE